MCASNRGQTQDTQMHTGSAVRFFSTAPLSELVPLFIRWTATCRSLSVRYAVDSGQFGRKT